MRNAYKESIEDKRTLSVDPVTGAALISGGSQLLGGALFGGGGGGGGYGFGENFSQSSGGGSSSGSSYSVQHPDQVWGAQIPFFQNLWGAGSGLMASGGNQAQAESMYNMGATGLQNIMNPGSNPLLDIYAQDLGRAFNQNIMPGIQQSAAGGNMMGGSRQGVAQGLASGEMGRQLSSFAGRQYQADMDRMLQGVGQAQQLGNFALGIPWHGLNQMSGLLGSPVVLGQGGYSESSNQAAHHSQSSGYGYDVNSKKFGRLDDIAGMLGGSPF